MPQTGVLDREMNGIAIPLSGKQTESNGRPGAEGMANRQRAMKDLELKIWRTDREQ